MRLNIEKDTTKNYPGPSCKKSLSWQKRKKKIVKSLEGNHEELSWPKLQEVTFLAKTKKRR
jgi:hypothetical protein